MCMKLFLLVFHNIDPITFSGIHNNNDLIGYVNRERCLDRTWYSCGLPRT